MAQKPMAKNMVHITIMNKSLIDFHSHVLPAIDDGSKDVYQSMRMLEQLKKQNVQTVIATSHYYVSKNSIPEFLAKRTASMEVLYKHIEQTNSFLDLEFVPGAEVTYYENISLNDKLAQLCIYGTKTLLLELPFAKLDQSIFEEVSLIADLGITPVIAHCERYLKFNNNIDIYNKLIDCGAYIQANAKFFSEPFTKNKALKLLKSNLIHVIGTDCHDMEKRPPNMDLAIHSIEKKLGENQVKKIVDNANKLLEGSKMIII